MNEVARFFWSDDLIMLFLRMSAIFWPKKQSLVDELCSGRAQERASEREVK